MSMKLERMTASTATTTPSNEKGYGSNGRAPRILPLFISSHATTNTRWTTTNRRLPAKTPIASARRSEMDLPRQRFFLLPHNRVYVRLALQGIFAHELNLLEIGCAASYRAPALSRSCCLRVRNCCSLPNYKWSLCLGLATVGVDEYSTPSRRGVLS